MISEIDPFAETFYQKLTSPANRQSMSAGEGKGGNPTRWELSPINRALMQRRLDAERIFDTLPDMETIISVAVSSMLCTKDLVTTTLIYDSHDPEGEIPLSVKDNMLNVIRDYFNKEDKLPQRLYEWLYEAMSVAGAVPVMIIPESSIDKMFNLSTESMSGGNEKPTAADLAKKLTMQTGYWGDPTGNPRLYTESYSKPSSDSSPFTISPFKDDADLGEVKITLTDNVDFLKAKRTMQRTIQRESFADSRLKELESSYKEDSKDKNKDVPPSVLGKKLNPSYDSNPENQEYISIPTAKEAGRSKTHPSRQSIPAESVIPVTIPGNELEPIGYLISSDTSGNPLSLRSVASLDNIILTNSAGGSDLISSSARALGLTDNEAQVPITKIMAKYGDMVERKFLASLENGMLGEGLGLGNNEEFYRVMYARHLAKRDTAVVYCPAEQMAYYAVDYDTNGMGRSVIDRSKVISTVRMVHLFATMNTMVQNSARNIQYEITLPEEERDPETALALAKSDIARSHNSFQPVWGDVDDIYAQTANAGIVFKVTGNEHYPTAEIQQSDITPDFKVPDKEIDENFVRRICQLARVDPDLILQPENIEFASQIYSKTLITTKQIIMKQQTLNKTNTRYCQSYTLSSGILLDKLVAAIKDSDGHEAEHNVKIPKYIRIFLDGLDVTIPPPDTSFTKSQMEQFEEKMEIIQKIIESVITEEAADEVGIDARKLQNVIKSWYSISWLRNNGVESELIDTILSEDEHQAMIKDVTDRHSSIAKLITLIDKKFGSKLQTVAKNFGHGGEENGLGDGEGLGDGGFGEDGDGLGDDSDGLGDDTDGLGGEDDILSDDTDIDADGPADADLDEESTDTDDDNDDKQEDEEDEDKGPEELEL